MTDRPQERAVVEGWPDPPVPSQPSPEPEPGDGGEDEVLHAIDKASRYVKDLCTGERRWTMSVPARPDEDPDLVISDALVKSEREIGRLRSRLAAAEKRAEELEAALEMSESAGGSFMRQAVEMMERAEAAESRVRELEALVDNTRTRGGVR